MRAVSDDQRFGKVTSVPNGAKHRLTIASSGSVDRLIPDRYIQVEFPTPSNSRLQALLTVLPSQSGIFKPGFNVRSGYINPHLSSQFSSAVLNRTFQGSSNASNLWMLVLKTRQDNSHLPKVISTIFQGLTYPIIHESVHTVHTRNSTALAWSASLACDTTIFSTITWPASLTDDLFAEITISKRYILVLPETICPVGSFFGRHSRKERMYVRHDKVGILN